ncbi:hypothetical protein CHRY9390_01712 [Chryseobacterium aquaeductus]|uniref:Glycosyl transferase family 1 domain-containing protein n=1 Tax=Chryseobacterium aquaeductus TaxID=2675056 RepID=A0A9N8QS84_9FLAO|nr:glycosyltransferase [Chryseobacterium aquaeductus]CAA7331032.1 hypothetical protein CHRY9390_01712 [Chryseobacterium potabilaquae]CAD7807769.1 hypothetical protein CHRY9390_01712 [Chryseobacterium aquaeductus]
MSKILFLTTAHNYNDDRIFYHQAKELKTRGYDVKITSLYSDYQGKIDGIEIESYAILNKSSREKIRVFQKICESYQPDCIICSEPLTVIAAKKFSKIKKASIIYDITEWYPSMRMVKNYSYPLKIIHALKFFLIQLYAGFLSKSYIFGEVTKKFPLAYFFPWKKSIVLPYYPDNIYIEKNFKQLKPNEIKLCYSGSFSKEKGIENFFNVADSLRKLRPELKVDLLLIGGVKSSEDELYFSKLLTKYSWENITIQKPVSFSKFSQSYADADVCFDLRPVNIENDHCLPIKLFYYIASGKPVIYSNLKAIREHLKDFNFGYLVNPDESEETAKYILSYVDDHHLYNQHAYNARKAFEKHYNWEIISKNFISFIKNSYKSK